MKKDSKVKVGESGFCQRFFKFLEAKDLNSNSLAESLNDSNPVKYRRWLAGEAEPSYEYLVEIAKKYNVSIDWLVFNQGAMFRSDTIEATVVEPESSIPVAVDDEKYKMKQTIALLEQKVTMLQRENERVWRLALPKEVAAELDFLRTSDHVTAYARHKQRVDGLVRYDNDERVCKVLPLNSLIEETLRILDSTQPFEQRA